ncbi:MAG: discoidin domain-containing protein [Methylococcaceae bacterium]|jgi:hypothetical protein
MAPLLSAADSDFPPASISAEGWRLQCSPGVRCSLTQSEGGMRLDYDYPANMGIISLVKTVDLNLPESYELAIEMRAEATDADIELKMSEISGQSTWAWRHYQAHWPTHWAVQIVPSQSLEWVAGSSRATPRHIDNIEWSFTPLRAGRGVIWLRDLAVKRRHSAAAVPGKIQVEASGFAPGHRPSAVMDGDPATAWRSSPMDRAPSLQVDLGVDADISGIQIEWCGREASQRYRLEVSTDGHDWQGLRTIQQGHVGHAAIDLPDTVTRYLRFRLLTGDAGSASCIRNLKVLTVAEAGTPNHFFRTVAQADKAGRYPKYFLGRQSYFTVVGGGVSQREALLNEDGALEIDRGGFSIEPFIYQAGKLVTWYEAKVSQSLPPHGLPLPSVTWQHGSMSLEIMAYAGEGDDLHVRYRLQNQGRQPEKISLFLALRPFQVNPPWQSLNMLGGFSELRTLGKERDGITVNEHWRVIPETVPNRMGFGRFHEGSIVDFLALGHVPPAQTVEDEAGYAEGVLAYDAVIPPLGTSEVSLILPGHGAESAGDDTTRNGDKRPNALLLARRYWQNRLSGPEFMGPAAAQTLIDAVHSNLAYILIHSDPPAFYPGSRTYERCWIRDAAMISSALLGLGYQDEVRDFIRWYAGFQQADGKIPCCVSRRGPEDVAENDSPGEFIFILAEYYRYARDPTLVRELWSQVVKTVAYIEGLMRQRMTLDYQSGEKSKFYGLVPESISHEGYSSHPVHAFWDDFWVLRGLKDAAELALIMADEPNSRKFSTLRDTFRTRLYTAIEKTIKDKKLAYLPASVELGDFDVNATAIAINVAAEENKVPAGPLARTFDEYAEYVEKRQSGAVSWDAYTPYEIRSVEAFVRLGRSSDAHKLLAFLMSGQRPKGWHQWAEVVWRDPAAPRFVGDMPHAWIGAEFIRAVRSLYVFESEQDHALVVGVVEYWASNRGKALADLVR